MTRTTQAQGGIGIYIRKSTEDRQSELSLPAQERIIRRQIVEPSGLAVYAVYRDILSGQRLDRSGYQQMLADARAGKLRMVAFHKVNRFGRNTAEGLMAVEELRKLGVEVRVADVPSLDIRKPEGMLLFTFLLSQGQYEVENLGTESRKGMQEKLEQGGWPFLAPDGYSNRREEVAPRKFRAWVAIDRQRGAIIRLMFRWYERDQTMTSTRIARRLNELHKQRVARGKSGCLRRSGSLWNREAVWRALTNRFYIGEVMAKAWNYTGVGSHPPLIRRAQFDRVQQILESHERGPIERHNYLLQNLLVFDNGSPLCCTTIQRQDRLYHYYYQLKASAPRRYYTAEPIEQQVIERIQAQIARMGSDPAEVLRREIGRSLVSLRRRARARCEELAEERQRVLHFARKGKFSEAEVDAELNRLAFDQECAQHEFVRAEMIETMLEALIDEGVVCVQAFAAWESLATAEQHEILCKVVQRVEMNAAGAVTRIVWQPLWDALLFPHALELGTAEAMPPAS